MTEIGPVEYIVVGFPGNQFKGEIAPALGDLVDAGTIRIIDIVFAGKDENGDLVAFELSALDPDVQQALEKLGAEPSGLFNEEDLTAVAETLDPGSSAAVLAWETCGTASALASRFASGDPPAPAGPARSSARMMTTGRRRRVISRLFVA